MMKIAAPRLRIGWPVTFASRTWWLNWRTFRAPTSNLTLLLRRRSEATCLSITLRTMVTNSLRTLSQNFKRSPLAGCRCTTRKFQMTLELTLLKRARINGRLREVRGAALDRSLRSGARMRDLASSAWCLRRVTTTIFLWTVPPSTPLDPSANKPNLTSRSKSTRRCDLSFYRRSPVQTSLIVIQLDQRCSHRRIKKREKSLTACIRAGGGEIRL